MSKEDLAKADKHLKANLEDEYILSCKRFPVDPAEFVKDKGAISDVHYITLIKHYDIFEKHYKNIEKTK